MVSAPFDLTADSESSRSGVSWAAVFAGAVAASALALMLLILGSGSASPHCRHSRIWARRRRV